MSDNDDIPDAGVTLDPGDAADEAFLFAVARNPARYEPLTDAEITAITAWTHGTASAEETDRAHSAIRRNLAAKELLLSLRLEQAAASGPPVSARVSKAILRQMAPPSAWTIWNFLGLPLIPNWQFASLGAVVAAAIMMIVVIRHTSGPDDARFQVAVLSDRSVLGETTGSVTRGVPNEPQANPTGRRKNDTLEFAEFDVPASILRDLFGLGAEASDTRTTVTLAEAIRLLRSQRVNVPPRLIFDREVEAAVKAGITSRLMTLRVYDLTLPGNAVLARALPGVGGTRAVFVTLPP